MCDSLVALGPVTAGGVTLFAKNSDRPPQEAQVIEWSEPRREVETVATHIAVAGFDQPTLRCVSPGRSGAGAPSTARTRRARRAR